FLLFDFRIFLKDKSIKLFTVWIFRPYAPLLLALWGRDINILRDWREVIRNIVEKYFILCKAHEG
ncbi:hypothetical protein CWM56_27900, partial [Klebsiella sp. E-Nf3]